jgi:hypothetical protein
MGYIVLMEGVIRVIRLGDFYWAVVLRESILDVLLYYNHTELKLYISNIASLLYYLRYL